MSVLASIIPLIFARSSSTLAPATCGCPARNATSQTSPGEQEKHNVCHHSLLPPAAFSTTSTTLRGPAPTRSGEDYLSLTTFPSRRTAGSSRSVTVPAPSPASCPQIRSVTITCKSRMSTSKTILREKLIGAFIKFIKPPGH